MKKPITLFIGLFLLTLSLSSQNRKVPVDTSFVTGHTTTINGVKISFTTTTGMQPVWNDKGVVIATLHYTYYKKSGTTDYSTRPLLISFNGGPGSGSLWMQLGYTGPYALNIDPEGYPVQPYGIHENPYSILDVADIVYVNPVNTGYSRMIPDEKDEEKGKQFFGIEADIKYLAGWLNTFVNRQDRWLSPKYLIGESYGGTRVAGLALELQENHWMYLNGVVLVSPADFNTFNSDRPIASALNLPYFAATAWYYKMLPPEFQQKKLPEILPEAEDFTIHELIPALTQGGYLDEKEKQKVAAKLAAFSGLPVKSVLQYNLDVPVSFFWKELLRDKKGLTIGRLDSRYLGIDKSEEGSSPDYNAELSTWTHAFAPAINYYMRDMLNFKTDLSYYVFGPVGNWNEENYNTRESLRKAMAENPFLKIMFQAGYFDGGTTYFQTKYMMWQLDPAGKMKDRMSFNAYESGHMMYIREEVLKSASTDLRSFILNSLPGGKPAKY